VILVKSPEHSRIQCIILAGGLGTRMKPLTEKYPKALLPARERPFAYYQLEWLAKNGITDVVYSIGYKGEMIRDYVRDGSEWGLRVSYSDEGEQLRGTAGALRIAEDQGLLAERFFVLYGDSFLPIDFMEVWKAFLASGKPALMTVFENHEQWDSSNVIVENGKLVLYQKKAPKELRQRMSHIDYGLSAMKRSVVGQKIPRLTEPGQQYDLAQVFYELSRDGELEGFEVRTRFYEIGSPAGLEDFENWLDNNA